MKDSLFKTFFIKCFLLLVMLGLSSAAGFIVAEYKVFPYEYVKKAKRVLFSMFPKSETKQAETKQAETKTPSEISTVFIRLKMRSVEVPVTIRGWGGGLTSFGKELLLVNYRGEIFTVNGETVSKTKIITPNNGVDGYIEASSMEKYKNYQFRPKLLRYNDILYYSEAGEHGLVLSFTEYQPDEECYNTTLAHLSLPHGIGSLLNVEAAADDWTIVYRTKPCLPLKPQLRALEGHMAGGRIGYQSPHKIILASGDYHWDGVYAPEALAQLTTNDYGKVIEIDLVEQKTRHISIGNRNMQGLLVDVNGQIWVTEHGVRGGDELNRVVEGANFGWPVETLGTRYNKLPWPSDGAYGRHDQFTKPTFAWVPSVATSNITQIAGFHPTWDGDFLVSSLAAQSLFRIRVQENRVIFVEPIKIGEGIRYAHQHTDGRIALWTDSNRIIFISLGEMSHIYAFIDTLITEADYDAQLKTKIRTTIEACSECHSFEAGDNVSAPSLGLIYEADIAATNFAGYSEALLAKDGAWRDDALIAFLTEPQAFASGTFMPDPGIDDPVVLGKLVEILKNIKQAE